MDFLFVWSTPPCPLLWVHHAVISLVEIWSSNLRATFLIRVSCRVAICFSMLGISKNLFLTVSFVINCNSTSSIFMPSMRQILRCRKTSILKRRDEQIDQLSHPHRSKFMGMASKMRYLLRLLTLASVHILVRAPID